MTLNTYTHLRLEGAMDEIRKMEEMGKARKELKKSKDENPVSKKMFQSI